MSRERVYEFLAAGTHTGKLATVRADGRPHVAPIWFVIDGDDLLFMTNESTVKGQSLRRDPRAALTVDLEEPPYAFATVEGTVTIETDPAAMLPHSIAIARRYMGDELADEYGRRNAVARRVPAAAHARRGSSAWTTWPGTDRRARQQPARSGRSSRWCSPRGHSCGHGARGPRQTATGSPCSSLSTSDAVVQVRPHRARGNQRLRVAVLAADEHHDGRRSRRPPGVR